MPGDNPHKRRQTPTFVGEPDASFRMDFGQRLAWLLARFESRAQAAEVAGVIADQLAKYVRGAAKPQLETMARLCEAKGVSLDWLATGRGAVPSSEAGEISGEWVLVPVYKVEASSGHGTFPTGDELRDPVKFPRPLLRKLASGSIEKLAVIFNRGDSNEPDIMNGDAMLVDCNVEHVRDNAFYVMGSGDKLYVKLIEREVDGTTHLKSRNPAYKEIVLEPGETEAWFRIFGRVVWRGGLV